MDRAILIAAAIALVFGVTLWVLMRGPKICKIHNIPMQWREKPTDPAAAFLERLFNPTKLYSDNDFVVYCEQCEEEANNSTQENPSTHRELALK
jgi:hypothetical protein